MLDIAMKIIWRTRVLKIIFLLALISVVPYILIVGLEKTESRKYDKARHLLISLRSNGSRKFPYHSITDERSEYGESKRPSGKNEIYGQTDVPMMMHYCNPPKDNMEWDDEGNPPKGYKLKMVHVFIRHGDRTSIHTIHGYDPGEYSCKFDTWYNGSDPKIRQFVPTMARYVGKQPGKSHFLNWALYPNKEKCDNSDLTSMGALQHIRNGQHFQERYINKSDLFDPKLALSSQIYVRSTEVSRTYQSSIALLYGFIPDFKVAHLNIDNSRGVFFCTSTHAWKEDCFCKHGKELSHHSKKFKKDFNSNRTSYQETRIKLANVFESNVEQLPWLTVALDALAPAYCHHAETPCSMWDSEKCVTPTLIRDIWNEAIATDGASTSDPKEYYLRYASVMLHPIMVEITRRLKDATQGRSRQRFVLYSGHDLTVSPLLMITGLYDGVWPPLASRFVIELYEKEGSVSRNASRHYLKFIYNGVDRTRDVIFCEGKTVDGLCAFSLLDEFVFQKLLRRFKYTSFKDACSRVKVT